MGFSTVFTMLTFLLIFTGMIVVVTQIQQSFSQTASQIQQQQQANLEAQQQEVFIQSNSYGNGDETSWIITYNDEFEKGSCLGCVIQEDAIVEVNFGQYNSTIYDTGGLSNYTTLSFEDSGTSQYRIRTSNDPNMTGATFVGPDGTSGTTYSVSGQTINQTIHTQERFVQFQATFVGALSGDKINKTQIGILRPGGHTLLIVENTGKQKLDFDETDVYVDGIRILRNENQRVLQKEILSNERLWDPGETLNITVFADISSATLVRVVNEHAQDEVVVTP